MNKSNLLIDSSQKSIRQKVVNFLKFEDFVYAFNPVTNTSGIIFNCNMYKHFESQIYIATATFVGNPFQVEFLVVSPTTRSSCMQVSHYSLCFTAPVTNHLDFRYHASPLIFLTVFCSFHVENHACLSPMC